MTNDEYNRAILQELHALQWELFTQQGEEIAALRRANESLQKSHDIIGRMLQMTADRLRNV